jgi:CdiI immunity protein
MTHNRGELGKPAVMLLAGLGLLILGFVALPHLSLWTVRWGTIPVYLVYFLVMSIATRLFWGGADPLIAAAKATVTNRSDVVTILERFFGTYFHRGWENDTANTYEAVDDFLTCERPSRNELHTLAAAIDQLVASYSEAELPTVLSRLGSHYTVTPPETYKSWLAEIATICRQSTVSR